MYLHRQIPKRINNSPGQRLTLINRRHHRICTHDLDATVGADLDVIPVDYKDVRKIAQKIVITFEHAC